MSRLPQGDRSNAELLAYLILGAAAQKGGESLLRRRSISSCGGWTRWWSPWTAPRPNPSSQLFLSIQDAKEQFTRSARRRLLPRPDLP